MVGGKKGIEMRAIKSKDTTMRFSGIHAGTGTTWISGDNNGGRGDNHQPGGITVSTLQRTAAIPKQRSRADVV